MPTPRLMKSDCKRTGRGCCSLFLLHLPPHTTCWVPKYKFRNLFSWSLTHFSAQIVAMFIIILHLYWIYCIKYNPVHPLSPPTFIPIPRDDHQHVLAPKYSAYIINVNRNLCDCKYRIIFELRIIGT